jgi:hypothetical protein
MTFISPALGYRTRFVCLGTPLATCTLPLGVVLLTYLLGEPTEREQPVKKGSFAHALSAARPRARLAHGGPGGHRERAGGAPTVTA